MKFTRGAAPSSQDFNDYQEYFKSALVASKRSKYGKVIEGLQLRYEFDALEIRAGCGFTSTGYYVQLRRDDGIDLSLRQSRSAFIFLKAGKLTTSNEILIKDESGKEFTKGHRIEGRLEPRISLKEKSMSKRSSFFDPYYTLDNDPEVLDKDCLLLGCMYENTLYQLNREENEPYYPVGTVFPYWGSFINYVTLKGCVVCEDDYKDRLIRLDSRNAGEEAGVWGWVLGKANIPSLKTKQTLTSKDGGHKHKYSNDRGILSRRYRYTDKTAYAYFNLNSEASSTYAGEHTHTATGVFKNSSPKTLDIFPDYVTCLPVRREY
ncbi:hypothetical protein [Borrelia sp. RT1S]|uniref:hypothetical protein n=1 Tax=Borrelia sp. RT1S TaxID=2898580 RepID=UPI001E548E97|nr:hypothetical protein [Borrelia sp. RT1S]UGQ17705.1 hypothetical protein LSO05_04580 [Borrelia sp. RT1S]